MIDNLLIKKSTIITIFTFVTLMIITDIVRFAVGEMSFQMVALNGAMDIMILAIYSFCVERIRESKEGS
jgi:hypothetical protein